MNRLADLKMPVPIFLAGGGEMGELIRSKDWSETSLGPVRDWPPILRSAVDIMLNNRFGMYIAWGDELIQLYNDAYRPILGSNKHPEALGLSSSITFHESWDIIGPMFGEVMEGKPVGFENFMLLLDRNGYKEECFFDFSFTPLHLENNKVGGVLVTVIETTEKILNLKKLEESKQQLQLAIDAAELATWDYFPLTNTFAANKRYEEWFGLPAGREIDFGLVLNVIAEKDRKSTLR